MATDTLFHGALKSESWLCSETSKLCIKLSASQEHRGFLRLAADEAMVLHATLHKALYGDAQS